MADVLIRDVPAHVLSAIDARAKQLGLSRTQYLRRRLAQDVESENAPVTVADLCSFSEAHADLADDAVMSAAWQ